MNDWTPDRTGIEARKEWFPRDWGNLLDWPPLEERTVFLDRSIAICGDTRTSLMMKIEAFDLADKGDSITYFRRQMSILNKVLSRPEISLDKILDEFTREQIEDIYPALSPILIRILVEELELMDYVRMEKDRVTVTKKGAGKLQKFKKSLRAEEREALMI